MNKANKEYYIYIFISIYSTDEYTCSYSAKIFIVLSNSEIFAKLSAQYHHAASVKLAVIFIEQNYPLLM